MGLQNASEGDAVLARSIGMHGDIGPRLQTALPLGHTAMAVEEIVTDIQPTEAIVLLLGVTGAH